MRFSCAVFTMTWTENQGFSQNLSSKPVAILWNYLLSYFIFPELEKQKRTNQNRRSPQTKQPKLPSDPRQNQKHFRWIRRNRKENRNKIKSSKLETTFQVVYNHSHTSSIYPKNCSKQKSKHSVIEENHLKPTIDSIMTLEKIIFWHIFIQGKNINWTLCHPYLSCNGQ